jgi:glutathione S-transferase
MRLFTRPASPFVRKVRVMARDIGLADQIDEIILASPEEMKSEMPKYNPLGKIPALILDDDTILYDSKVICEYLDSLHNGEKFFPTELKARWKTLLLQGLADGIGEAIIIAAMNKFNRPEKFIYEPAISFQLEKAERGLLEINGQIADFNKLGKIGPLSVACTIGYIDFRFPDLGWRERNSTLADWYANFCNLPSMRATEFKPEN